MSENSSLINSFIDSVIKMPGEFADVVLNGGINPLLQGVLVLFGALFVAIPSILLLYFTLGAGFDLVRPGSAAATHPEE